MSHPFFWDTHHELALLEKSDYGRRFSCKRKVSKSDAGV